ncbi:hypothetical protein SAMN05216184_105195 [Georgenia satyanarayanai]|uniref:HEPN AbiJ-N-terminal domain-containing protein n=1 Tax=Georgenia satyanarayanai TaxID=860221 RepID=A0A2Y9ACL7_9MICO|nr:hypothetical protein [Georgenia satyanarayanai]PYF99951.1 hypothetical protein A8987_105195 [Georgenia satyanarayanai]SSA41955.1 hypothetical protein SAMN05216184_105195 [Georgenia satyanarayanai]
MTDAPNVKASNFSQQYGYEPIPNTLQREEMDGRLRNAIWNRLFVFQDRLRKSSTDSFDHVPLVRHWASQGKPIDEIPTYVRQYFAYLKTSIQRADWHHVYDLIQHFASEEHYGDTGFAGFSELVNGALEQHLSAWTIIDGQVVELHASTDVEAVRAALTDTEGLPGARHHLTRALAIMSNRDNPDASNTIKEAISAVESVCGSINGKKGTLGDALSKLEKSGVTIHPALINGWKAIYGYTSDADGIRHASIEVPKSDVAMARYMMVSCSAFVSLLIKYAQEAGISLISGSP